MRNVMQKFLPKYIDNIENEAFPKSFHYEILPRLGNLGWIIDWTDIKYSDITLDVEDVKILLTEGDSFPLIKVDFPAIKEWEIDAFQTVNTWILPSSS